MTYVLEQEAVSSFNEIGVAVVRGAFNQWVETLRAGVAFNLERPGPHGRSYVGDGGDGRFFSDYCNWQRIPQYQDFIFRSPAASIALQLMDSSFVQLFHEHVLVKEAATDVATPWHQDAPYYCVRGAKTVSFWIPLDDVPRERTLEFVAGSHKAGKEFQPQFFNGNPLNERDGLETIPDINCNRDAFDIRGWALSLGDAVAFDFRTIHGAPANKSSSNQRRAFSLRLVGEGTKFWRGKERVTSPPFPEVTLKDGEDLRGEQFPVLVRS